MNTKRISDRALAVIDQYRNVPYFNNRSKGRRAGLLVETGKGSPKEIYDEVKEIAFAEKIKFESLDQDSIKRIMVENGIGIECSGFAFYVLNEESQYLKRGTLDRHLHFPYANGILGWMRSKFRPIANTNVKTFAHDANSKLIQIKDAMVGDIITMVGGPEDGERDHILVVHQIEYQNLLPITVHYVHAVAWPTDGEFGHGIHEGKIEIVDLNKTLVEQRWIELDKTNEENYTFSRAKKSKTELRRLNWF